MTRHSYIDPSQSAGRTQGPRRIPPAKRRSRKPSGWFFFAARGFIAPPSLPSAHNRIDARRSNSLSALCGGAKMIAGRCSCSALALTADRVDPGDGVLVFESLKKRRKGVYRAVPVPPDFLDRLRLVHDLELLRHSEDRGRGVRLWPWSRTTASGCLCLGSDGMRGARRHPRPRPSGPAPRLRHQGGDIRGATQYDPEMAGAFAYSHDRDLYQRRGTRGKNRSQNACGCERAVLKTS